MKLLKRTARFLIGPLLTCFIGFLVITWWSASHLICPKRQPLEDHHRVILDHSNEHGLIIQRFTVRTSDGYETPCLLCDPSKQPGAAIKGNKVRAELQAKGFTISPWGEVKGTLVLLHGHNGRKENFLAVAERFCAAGFRCILMDLPGHGDHPAKYSTFGVNEAKLPHEVLQAAAKRFSFAPQPAGLFGISQGGAIALQTAAREGEAWFAIAELSAFAALDDVIATQARFIFGTLEKPAHATTRWIVQLRAGFNPEQVRPIDAAMQLKDRAVLIGHGANDAFVDFTHANRLYEAVPSARKEFLKVPTADHGNVLTTSTPVYATVSAFFLKALGASAGAVGTKPSNGH